MSSFVANVQSSTPWPVGRGDPLGSGFRKVSPGSGAGGPVNFLRTFPSPLESAYSTLDMVRYVQLPELGVSAKSGRHRTSLWRAKGISRDEIQRRMVGVSSTRNHVDRPMGRRREGKLKSTPEHLREPCHIPGWALCYAVGRYPWYMTTIEGRHQGTTNLLCYFEYSHLPAHLQNMSKPFKHTAHGLADALPDSAELTAALRKLLEAKDCAVRAALDASREECS